MLSRNEALGLIDQYIKNEKLKKHMLAVEAIMRALARKLGKDEKLWGLVGLLHDIDYELAHEKGEDWMKYHGILAEEILKGKLPNEALHAIKAHNFENTGVKPQSDLDYALIASDSISGLIIACALVMPNKKLEEVKIETIAKKFKSKDFCRRIKREHITYCEKLGLKLGEFFELSLNALKEIASDLGL